MRCVFRITSFIFLYIVLFILSDYVSAYGSGQNQLFSLEEKIKIPSSIIWVQYYNNNDEHLLFSQTEDGNIHQFTIGSNKSSSGINFNVIERAVYEIFASNSSSPLVSNIINGTLHNKIVSVSNDGNMAVIDIDTNKIRWINNTHLSPFTTPVLYTINNTQIILTLSKNGTLLQFDPQSNFTSKSMNFTNILPDSRVIIDDLDNDALDEVLLLSKPTDRYPHGALGDRIEAEGLLILKYCGDANNIFKLCLKNMLEPPENKVFESLSPFVVNLNGSNNKDKQIALVASDNIVGSNIVIYGIDSKVLFSSEPIGKPFRWMLILGYGNFNGLKLVVNEVPHLDGIIKFINTKNEMSVETNGYSAHNYGSRNIDSIKIIETNSGFCGANDVIRSINYNSDLVIIPDLDKDLLNILYVTPDDKIISLKTFPLESSIMSNILVEDIDGDGNKDIIAGDKLGNIYFFECI